MVFNMSGTLWTFNSLIVTLYSLDSVLNLLSLHLSNGVLLIGVVDIHGSNLHTGSTLKFLLEMAI